MLTKGNEMLGRRSTFMSESETKPRMTSEQMNISIARGRVIARRVRPMGDFLPCALRLGRRGAGRLGGGIRWLRGRVRGPGRPALWLAGCAALGLARRAGASADADRVPVVDGRLPGHDDLVAGVDPGRRLEVLLVAQPERHLDLLGTPVLGDEDDGLAAALDQRLLREEHRVWLLLGHDLDLGEHADAQ